MTRDVAKHYFKEDFSEEKYLKAIYHSSDTVCIWVFKTRNDRNNFKDETLGMMREDRENHYSMHYA